MLYYVILNYIISYYIILYHIILYYTILYYIILYSIILYYIILYYIILYYIILYYIILYYIILCYIYYTSTWGFPYPQSSVVWGRDLHHETTAIFLATSKKQLVTSMSRAWSSWCSCNREFIGTDVRKDTTITGWWLTEKYESVGMIQTTNNQLLQDIFWDSFVTQRRIPHGHGLDLSFQWPECPCWIILPELEIVQILIEKICFLVIQLSIHGQKSRQPTLPHFHLTEQIPNTWWTISHS